MSGPILEVQGLTRIFRTPVKAAGMGASIKQLFKPKHNDFRAVDGVTFELAEGEFVGFLGPNGAGKTTTIKMLTGIIAPTSGTARILGFEPFKRDPVMLRQIALVAGNRQQLWWDLPAADSFEVLTEIYGVDRAAAKARIDRLVEGLELKDKINVQVRKLSLGERMKCELVAALIHRPRVVFLDEPTIGLDILSQRRIRDFLREFNREEGCTILLTSHYMQDIEELCPRVVIIDKGKVAYDGGLDQLKANFPQGRRITFTFHEQNKHDDVKQLGEVLEETEQSLTLGVADADVARICGQVLQSHKVSDMQIQEPAIEDVISKLFAPTRA